MMINRKIKFITLISFVSLILCFTVICEAKIRLPSLVSDGMVLQREQNIAVWGFADSGEEVKVSFLKQNYQTKADAEGNWKVILAPMKPGGPYSMTINDLEIKDILIGDVWLCSGQSNMETPMSRVMDLYADEILSYTNTKIRHIKLPMDYNFHGSQDNTKPAVWKPVTQEHVLSLTAVPYFFAKYLYKEIDVPIGLINSSVGGSPDRKSTRLNSSH